MSTNENTEEETGPAQFTDNEVFTLIWTKPREVFRYIHEYHYDKYMYVLIFLASVVNALQRASTNNLGANNSLTFVLVVTITVGGIIGVVMYYVYASISSFAGKLLGGKAKAHTLLRVYAYSAIPLVCTLPITAIQIVLFGNDLFNGELELDNYDVVSRSAYFISIIIELTLAIWSCCLAIVGTSEVQKFSIGRALGNALLAGLILVAGLILIIMPFMILKAI